MEYYILYIFSNHDMAHIGTTVIRCFPRLIERMFGKGGASPVFTDVAYELLEVIFPHWHDAQSTNLSYLLI